MGILVLACCKDKVEIGTPLQEDISVTAFSKERVGSGICSPWGGGAMPNSGTGGRVLLCDVLLSVTAISGRGG